MEGQSLIEGIKSKYILKHILNFIEDKSLPLEIFINSKKYQNKLEIDSIYKEKYIKGIDINKFLYQSEVYNNNQNNLLIKEYREFLIKNNFKQTKFENIVYEVKNKEDKYIIKEDFETKICIESPLFEVISKTKNFENNYTIFISQQGIDKYKLKNTYKNFFNKLNKSNVKYSSIYFVFNESNKIKYLKDINIDFDKIKRITFVFDEINHFDKKVIFDDFDHYQDDFWTLFSFNMQENLIYLKMDIKSYQINPFFYEFFEDGEINNFVSLNYLYIIGAGMIFSFLELKNLKFFSLKNSYHISLSKSVNFNQLKEINLSKSKYIFEDLKNVKCQNLEILNLSNNSGLDLDELMEMKFRKLLRLDLSYNNLNGINILEVVTFEQLEILDLSYNNISNIDSLEFVNFKQLRELNLSNNKISNIDVLQKVQFQKLEILDLGCNSILFIYFLENFDFEQLKELHLYNNKISNIDIFETVNFPKLEKINLGNNNISNIDVLEYVNFKRLKELKLYSNYITDIKVLEKVKFEDLEKLDLENNRISDINVLKNVNFRKLKKLNLSINIISDIKVLSKVNFEKLEILDLGNTCISDINVLDKIILKRLKKLYLYGNKILFDTKILNNKNFSGVEIYY